ncbi:hypothetical protein TKK_0010005 [Trichogramma kaykai]
MTLHFYSPKGYEYVRSSFSMLLPHPSTLRDWLRTINYEPGIFREAFQTVEDFVKIALNQGQLKTKTTRKKLPLVFMLICINGYFKIPVAYYLINSLNGDQKSSLLLEILDECYVHGVDVRNITFDGASSNIRRKEEGLHLATKIRRRHVEPFNEKMKVCLAAQVLSRSVAAALEICEHELELEEFQGAKATARFCRVIDDCFDFLNSRNRYNKCPSKSAITRDNLEDYRVKVNTYAAYIEALKIDEQPTLKTKKRTGFVGLIIAMKNAVQMTTDMFAEGSLEFVLTYKLSQGHLEMFFACIRKAGGFNNNPTTIQFKSAYRKLIPHVSIKVPLTANCTPKDDTLILLRGNQMIRLIFRHYFSLRLHHEVAKRSEFKSRVRTKFQRLIVFQNQ